MNPRISRLALPVAAVLLTLAGCSQRPGAPASGDAPGPTDDEVARARTLYENASCGVCHGESGEGVEPNAPALGGLASYWDEERLAAYLLDPAAFRAANPDFEARGKQTYEMEMPAFDYLSEEERRALARWLLTF